MGLITGEIVGSLDSLEKGSILKALTSWESLPRWCHFNARYGVPTQELIGWLLFQIGARSLIEIGAGHGDFARFLGCPDTDSKLQSDPAVNLFYKTLGQPTINYPAWVDQIEAEDAVRKYKPDAVFASWVTQYASEDSGIEGSSYGVNEEALLDTGVMYVFLGNRNTHGAKRILKRPHEEHALPFIRSRASKPEDNCV